MCAAATGLWKTGPTALAPVYPGIPGNSKPSINFTTIGGISSVILDSVVCLDPTSADAVEVGKEMLRRLSGDAAAYTVLKKTTEWKGKLQQLVMGDSYDPLKKKAVIVFALPSVVEKKAVTASIVSGKPVPTNLMQALMAHQKRICVEQSQHQEEYAASDKYLAHVERCREFAPEGLEQSVIEAAGAAF